MLSRERFPAKLLPGEDGGEVAPVRVEDGGIVATPAQREHRVEQRGNLRRLAHELHVVQAPQPKRPHALDLPARIVQRVYANSLIFSFSRSPS